MFLGNIPAASGVLPLGLQQLDEWSGSLQLDTSKPPLGGKPTTPTMITGISHPTTE